MNGRLGEWGSGNWSRMEVVEAEGGVGEVVGVEVGPELAGYDDR